ncbi:MAG: hypothetical protein KKB13_03915, partial [Chloroflexi bacterium]|nr:hypothetical protein [Chloroflexota bacterium]
TRPRDLYYYQGAGLQALYGFTYKYLTLEHSRSVGQLTRVRVGAALAESLAAAYTQAWYPADEPLTIFADWHIKPHWTKGYSHAGRVTMWGRTMPGTKQLILNGPRGRLLGGWDYPIDAHLTHLLVDLETALEQTLQRPIACVITDSEGGGQPLGERYAAAQRDYLSILPQEHHYRRADFVREGAWEPVTGDPAHSAALARWADPARVAQDPRQFVLLRPHGQSEPTRIYTGRFSGELTAGEVPWLHRRRWPYNELRIRDLIQGANLNANYGYAHQKVVNRTRQRAWEAAQTQVTVTERQLSDHQDAVRHLRRRLADLQESYTAQQRDLARRLAHQRWDLRHRQDQSQTTTRAQQRVDGVRRELAQNTEQFRQRQRRLVEQLHHHQTQARQLRARLVQRMAARDAIDTATLCRERDLEKDQIMLNFQVLLANLHDWAAQHYFAPAWQSLSLETATLLIYRKAGRVTWHDDRVSVELEPYRYPDQQRLMEVTCARFNAANVRWRDGRLLRITVAPRA